LPKAECVFSSEHVLVYLARMPTLSFGYLFSQYGQQRYWLSMVSQVDIKAIINAPFDFFLTET